MRARICTSGPFAGSLTSTAPGGPRLTPDIARHAASAIAVAQAPARPHDPVRRQPAHQLSLVVHRQLAVTLLQMVAYRGRREPECRRDGGVGLSGRKALCDPALAGRASRSGRTGTGAMVPSCNGAFALLIRAWTPYDHRRKSRHWKWRRAQEEHMKAHAVFAATAVVAGAMAFPVAASLQDVFGQRCRRAGAQWRRLKPPEHRNGAGAWRMAILLAGLVPVSGTVRHRSRKHRHAYPRPVKEHTP